MNHVKSINRVFLVTVIVTIIGLFVNTFLYQITNNYGLILITSQVLIALPSFIYLWVKKINVFKAIRLKKVDIGSIILIILFSYLMSPLMGLINLISSMFVRNDTQTLITEVSSDVGLLFSIVFIALVPCILEELVYRGIFYNEYRKVNVIKGIFLSGFLFGIIHRNFNQFSYAFAMGIIFALLIEATDSILSTMIVHFCTNATSVVTVYILPKLYKVMETIYGEEYTDTLTSTTANMKVDTATLRTVGIYALISSCLAFIVYKTIAKRNGRWEYIKGIFKGNKSSEQVAGANNTDLGYSSPLDDESTQVQSKKLVTPSLIIGILICIVLMIINEIPALS